MTNNIISTSTNFFDTPLEEVPLGELFTSEAALEDVVVQCVSGCGPYLTSRGLMVIGRHVPLSAEEDGPVIRILAISRSANLWVVDVQTASDSLGVSRAVGCAGLAAKIIDAETVVATYQAYLQNVRGEAVQYSEALAELVRYCGQEFMGEPSAFQISSATPGVLIASATTPIWERQVVSFYESLGLSVLHTRLRAVRVEHGLSFSLMRVLPLGLLQADEGGEAVHTTSKRRTAQTSSKILRPSRQARKMTAARQAKIESTMEDILKSLVELAQDNESMVLMSRLGELVDSRHFSDAIAYLESYNLIHRVRVSNGRRGGNPYYVGITREGEYALGGGMSWPRDRIGWAVFGCNEHEEHEEYEEHDEHDWFYGAGS